MKGKTCSALNPAMNRVANSQNQQQNSFEQDFYLVAYKLSTTTNNQTEYNGNCNSNKRGKEWPGLLKWKFVENSPHLPRVFPNLDEDPNFALLSILL